MNKISKVLLIINVSSGAANSGKFDPEYIKALFEKNNITAEIHSLTKKIPGSILNGIKSNDYDAVIAVGGDGTINSVANLLSGTSIPIGIIPVGTFNHFAKDMNIPLKPEEAVKVIAEGRSSYIDSAIVNDRLFVNNSSLGLYPLSLIEREEQEKKYKRYKWTSMFYGVLSVFKRFPLYSINIEIEGKIKTYRSPAVFIGNNEYDISLFTFGKRSSINKGVLSVFIAVCSNRWEIFKLFFKIVFKELQKIENIHAVLTDEIIIESKKKKLAVSVDGEVIFLKPPLVYKICKNNIKVICPGN